jgi:hypothetical protein
LSLRREEGSSSFLKKRTKKLLFIWACSLVQRERQWTKVFASFFKNKCFLSLLLFAGCAVQPPPCLLASQRPMAVIDMFFGRDVPGRAPVSDDEWAAFVAAQVAPRFPAGFTVFDASGQWLSPAGGRVVREASKMVRMVAPAAPDLAARVQGVSDAYKGLFRQESVGVVSTEGCAAF